MTQEDLRKVFMEELVRVAPDLAPEGIAGDSHLLDDLELDSMDVVRLVAALHKRLGLAIPEADYEQLQTPDAAVAYLSRKVSVET